MKLLNYATLPIIALGLFVTVASATVSAGEVRVVSTVNFGVLSDITVLGSVDDDNVTIRTNSRGETLIIGNRGTTINFNGATQRRVNVGGVLNASVFLGGGDDRLRVVNQSLTTLDVRMGRGNDFARFSNLQLLDVNGGVFRGGAGDDAVVGGINTLALISVEVANVFASAFDRGEPIVVASEFVTVDDGDIVDSQLAVGESFVFAEDFTGSATISGFDSHGERGLPQDLIDVSAIDADVTQPGNQDFTLVLDFRGNPGELIIPNDNNLSTPFTIAGDVDGDAVADFTITLDNFSSFVLQSIGPWFNNFVP